MTSAHDSDHELRRPSGKGVASGGRWFRRARRTAWVLGALLLAIASLTTSAAAADSAATRWSWPVEPAVLTRGYEAPATRYAAGHRGIDLAAPVGSVVSSPDDGVVRFAGWVVDRPVVSIDHGEGIVSSFEPVTAEVAEGQYVSRGQRIGVLASADHCADRGAGAEVGASGCVHLGARLDGEYFSPLVMLGGVPRAVLLPVD